MRRKLESPVHILDNIYSSRSTKKEFLSLVKKYRLSGTHIKVLILILHFLCLKENFKGINPKAKYKNLYLGGPPSCGKTSLLSLFSKTYGDSLFYQVGDRGRDFTGYYSSLNPIIIFDDCLQYPYLN